MVIPAWNMIFILLIFTKPIIYTYTYISITNKYVMPFSYVNKLSIFLYLYDRKWRYTNLVSKWLYFNVVTVI